VLLFNGDPEQLARWSNVLEEGCYVQATCRADDLESLLEQENVDAVVSDWPDQLLDAVPALRKGVRLIHCGSSIPDSIIDAASQGYSVSHVERIEELPEQVYALTRPARSLDARRQVGGIFVTYARSAARHPLSEISNDGLSFIVGLEHDIEPLLPGNVIENVSLLADSAVALDGVRAKIRHVAVSAYPEMGYRVGCELFAPAISDSAAAKNVIRDRAFSLGLLRSAFRRGGVLLQAADQSALAIQCVGGRVDPTQNEMILPLADNVFRQYDPVAGRFEVAGCIYRFSTVVVSSAPLRLRLPTVLEETHNRTSARYQPPPTNPLMAEFSSPLFERPVERPVWDVSGTGCALEIEPQQDLFPVGLNFTRIRLFAAEGPISCKGRVKNLLRAPDRPDRLRCGIEFEALDSSSRLRLADLIMRGRFPALDDGRRVAFGPLWSFLTETNFIYAEKEKILAPLLPEIERTMGCLNARPNKVFKSLVAHRAGRLAGYVSGVLAYRNTWLSQHLAAAARGQLGALLNIGLAEYFGQDSELEYCKVYFRPENRWPARIFGSFARKVSDQRLSVLRTYSYLTIPTTSHAIPALGPVEIVEAKASELAIVERSVVAAEPGLILRSDDLTRAGLELAEVNNRYKELGLSRRRRVLIALVHDTPVAFALAEISSPGLNFSELLNAFRIYCLTDNPLVAEASYRALLAQMVQVYREAGRPYAVGLALPHEIRYFEQAGYSARKRYTSWTCSRALYLRFGEHVEHVMDALSDRQKRRSTRLSSGDIGAPAPMHRLMSADQDGARSGG
jgi:hypothetical protein